MPKAAKKKVGRKRTKKRPPGRKPNTRLTPRQLAAIKLLGSIPPEYKNFDDACEKLGIVRNTLWEWRKKNEKFKKALAKRLHENYLTAGGFVRRSHINRAIAGNVFAIKLFYQHGEGWVEKMGLQADKPIPIIDVSKSRKKKSNPKKAG